MFAAALRTTSNPSSIVSILKISEVLDGAVDGVAMDFPALGTLQESN